MPRHWPLLALVLLFSTPLFAAVFVLLHSQSQPFNTTQHGTFVSRTTDMHFVNLYNANGTLIAPEIIKNKWRLVYTNLQHQNILQQLHTALGVDSSRVILASATTTTNVMPDADIFIVDPLGHCVMYYTAQNNASGILKDLKRLLKYSHAT